MARQRRFAVGGQAHLVLLPGHVGRPVFRDDDDRRNFLGAMREAGALHRVLVHAYALLDDQVWLLATPPEDAALGAWIQSIGRRYVAGFNRRHGSAGTLWAGRFRAAVVQPGEPLRQSTLAVDLRPVRFGLVEDAARHAWSSARHHLGIVRDPAITMGAAYWALGNTPFEREAAYRRALDEGLSETLWGWIESAVRQGRVLGESRFVTELQQLSGRPLQPRRRGRPRRTAS